MLPAMRFKVEPHALAGPRGPRAQSRGFDRSAYLRVGVIVALEVGKNRMESLGDVAKQQIYYVTLATAWKPTTAL